MYASTGGFRIVLGEAGWNYHTGVVAFVNLGSRAEGHELSSQVILHFRAGRNTIDA